jgi:hypothetical protein
MCTGFHENCSCEDCEYANMLYRELEFFENFLPEDTEEIERIIYELESMGYTV